MRNATLLHFFKALLCLFSVISLGPLLSVAVFDRVLAMRSASQVLPDSSESSAMTD